MDADSVDGMEDADALCCNRDVCAPDPGGMGDPYCPLVAQGQVKNTLLGLMGIMFNKLMDKTAF
eukprot:3941080-Ditylum_brightwellii.AAC.1